MLYFINEKKYFNSTLADLWKQKNFFFLWFLGLALGFIALISLNAISLAFVVIDKNELIQDYMDTFSDKNITWDYASRVWTSSVIQSSLNLFVVSTGLVSLTLSIFKSIKLKSFASFSYWPTLLIFFNTLYVFPFLLSTFIQYSFNLNSYFSTSPSSIIGFVIPFIYLLTWFLISRNVSVIRRIFIRAQFTETMNAFQATQTTTGEPGATPFNNPYGFPMGANQNPSQNADLQGNASQASINKMEEDEAYKRLKALSKKQLDQIAVQLSISGFEMMNKDELLKTIYKITTLNSKPKEEPKTDEEIKVEEKSEEDQIS